MEKIKTIKTALEVAKQIIDKEISIVEGCRTLTNLRLNIDPDNEIFLLFRGVSSETDDYPLGEARKYWDEKALAKLDTEIKEYENRIREDVNKACWHLIEKLSSNK
jgi:hypothetical protein